MIDIPIMTPMEQDTDMSEEAFKIRQLEKLDGIEREAKEMTSEERIEEEVTKALEHLVLNKMFHNKYGHNMNSYDKLNGRKLRTHVGLITENLMKLLLKLDEVNSDGVEEIKIKRKQIVKLINEAYLPRIDEYLFKAQCIVTLYNKINRLIIIKKEHTNRSFKVNESEQASNELKVGNIVQAKESPKEIQESKSIESSEDDKDYDNCDKRLEKNLPEPEYKIVETSDSVIIKLFLPKHERASQVEFQLHEENNELLVTGNTFEFPFQINQRKYGLNETKVRLMNEHMIRIVIPKRRQQGNYAQANFEHPFFGRRTYIPQEYEGPSNNYFYRPAVNTYPSPHSYFW